MFVASSPIANISTFESNFVESRHFYDRPEASLILVFPETGTQNTILLHAAVKCKCVFLVLYFLPLHRLCSNLLLQQMQKFSLFFVSRDVVVHFIIRRPWFGWEATSFSRGRMNQKYWTKVGHRGFIKKSVLFRQTRTN